MDASFTEPDVTNRAISGLRKALGDRLVAVVLFGSRARGDASEASDWDLLVLARGLPENAMERHLSLKKSLPAPYRGSISPLARTPEEFEGRLPSLYLDLALDGRNLYDSLGYAAERLGRVRRIIERAGLQRFHTPAGDVWRWTEEPRGPWVLEWDH